MKPLLLGLLFFLGAAMPDIPSIAQPYMPKSGGVFVSGGLLSTARLAAFDLDTGKITLIEGQIGKPVDPKTDKTVVTTAPKETIQRLRLLTSMVIMSPQSFLNKSPTADFDVIGTLRYKNLTRDIHTYGPPTSYLAELYELVWSMKP